MFTTPLHLRDHEPGEWVVTSPLRWREGGKDIVVPANFITDLASIPRPLRGVLNVNGRSRKPAVLHDYAYCLQWASRKDADALFLRALIAEGMHPAVARTYWLGVRAGGWLYWNRRARQPLSLEYDFASRDSSAAPHTSASASGAR